MQLDLVDIEPRLDPNMLLVVIRDIMTIICLMVDLVMGEANYIVQT